jgi:hypothetical protein
MTFLKIIDVSSEAPDFIPSENQKSQHDSNVYQVIAILDAREAQDSHCLPEQRIFRPPRKATP